MSQDQPLCQSSCPTGRPAWSLRPAVAYHVLTLLLPLNAAVPLTSSAVGGAELVAGGQSGSSVGGKKYCWRGATSSRGAGRHSRNISTSGSPGGAVRYCQDGRDGCAQGCCLLREHCPFPGTLVCLCGCSRWLVPERGVCLMETCPWLPEPVAPWIRPVGDRRSSQVVVTCFKYKTLSVYYRTLSKM